MRLKDIIGLIIALLLALGVALLTRYFLTKEASPKDQTPPPSVALTKIMVAGKPLKVGDVIKPSDLVWQGWPKNALNPTYINEGAVAIDSLNGFIVKAPLDPGEPVHLEDIVDPKGKGFLAAIIAPGKRAYSIKITPENSSTGLIFPGDSVDVIVSMSQNVEGRTVSQGNIVVANIKVLAMGTELAAPQTTPKPPPTVATLEVTPQEADKIAAAEKEGTLSLSLHGLQNEAEEEKVAASESPSSEEEKAKKTSVVIIRGKEKTEVEVREPGQHLSGETKE